MLCTQEKRIKIYQIYILVFLLMTLTNIYVQVNHIFYDDAITDDPVDVCTICECE